MDKNPNVPTWIWTAVTQHFDSRAFNERDNFQIFFGKKFVGREWQWNYVASLLVQFLLHVKCFFVSGPGRARHDHPICVMLSRFPLKASEREAHFWIDSPEVRDQRQTLPELWTDKSRHKDWNRP
jgi:hypothetical protein